MLTDPEYGESGIAEGVESYMALSVLISGDLRPLKTRPVALKKIANAIRLRALHLAEQSDP
jgi:hypothetical protein